MVRGVRPLVRGGEAVKVAVARATTGRAVPGKLGKQGAAAAAARRAPAVLRGRAEAEHRTVARWSMPVAEMPLVLAGSGGSGSSGDGGPSVGVVRSGGCDKPTTQAANQWVESMVMAGTTSRATSVRLPSNYDPSRAYPVIVLLHGCGAGRTTCRWKTRPARTRFSCAARSASGTCWETAANGADVAFFDAMVTDAKDRFCADEKRFFVVGYSSGSWLVNQLTCIRTKCCAAAPR